jgi:DNA polymerase
MALAVAEVNREDCYLTTALKCRPVIGRPGDLRELQQCAKTWLFQELTLVKPKIIVVLGREAHTALRLPKEQWGHVTLYTSARATYVIGYSPSYFLWSKRIDEFRPVGLLLRSAIDEHLKEAT